MTRLDADTPAATTLDLWAWAFNLLWLLIWGYFGLFGQYPDVIGQNALLIGVAALGPLNLWALGQTRRRWVNWSGRSINATGIVAGVVVLALVTMDEDSLTDKAIDFGMVLVVNFYFIFHLHRLIRSHGTGRVWQWPAWLAGGPVLLVLFLYLILLAINLRDEPLNPEIDKILAGTPVNVADRDNAYVHAMGFLAPLDQNPLEAGQARLKKLRAALDQGSVNEPDWHPIELKDPGERLCRASVADRCTLDAYLKGAPTLEGDNQILLRRYEGLLDLPSYRETLGYHPRWWSVWYDLPFPTHGKGQLLLLTRVAQLTDQGQASKAALLLTRDIRFNRMVLSQTGDRFTKEVATRLLRRDFLLASEMLREPGLSEQVKGDLLAALPPLNQAELSLRSAWNAEHFILLSIPATFNNPGHRQGILGKDKDGLIERLARSLYQPNATANLAYRRLLEETQTMETSPQDIPGKQSRLAEENLNVFHLVPYNFMGHVFDDMRRTSLPNVLVYVIRQHNTEALRRLVILQAGLPEQARDEASIRTWLSESPPALRNPYTGQPAQWDGKQRSLRFQVPKESQEKNDPPGVRLEVFL